MSAISLFASENARVIAFDSDLSSLKATLNMCSYASGKRIETVWGLISEKSTIKRTIKEATRYSADVLKSSKVSGKLGTTRYINLDRADGNIPFYSLDTLFDGQPDKSKMLIKCDIEGAELLALSGGIKLIASRRPALLLSIHPGILPVFDGSVEQVRKLLESLNYKTEIISIDHEEHWWCLPI
jgi:FkbM family methyltransferase